MAKTEGFIPAVLQLISGPGFKHILLCQFSGKKVIQKIHDFFFGGKRNEFFCFHFFFYMPNPDQLSRCGVLMSEQSQCSFSVNTL